MRWVWTVHGPMVQMTLWPVKRNFNIFKPQNPNASRQLPTTNIQYDLKEQQHALQQVIAPQNQTLYPHTASST